MLAQQTNHVQPESDTFTRFESKVQSYARSFPALFQRARGTELWDAQGHRYLDFLAGAGSLNYGHNNPVLKKALIEYIESDAITHSLDLHTQAKEEFLQAMQDIVLAPRGLDYVVQFTGPTGANAVEAALKLARKVTGRTNVIFFTNGFHGVSQGALAVTGNEHFRRAAGIPLSGAISMPYDGYLGEDLDTIAYLDRMLADRSSGIDMPAAVILEVVQGEGGLNSASARWLQRLQALCQEHKIVLIVDEIQSGCGRTGTFFSFEPAGIKPDIVTLSKSLSGYGLPFSVVLINRALDLWKPAEHNGTFRGNNHAFVTATAMLREYWRTAAFAEEVSEKSKYLGRRLQAMVEDFSPDLVKVKGRGMMQGILCADPKQAACITATAYKGGLIIERAGPQDEVIKCMMPLTTSYAVLDEGLDILEDAIAKVFSRTARGYTTINVPKATPSRLVPDQALELAV
jgi:diaminobutyrate-2-oxoglutarate transaminase